MITVKELTKVYELSRDNRVIALGGVSLTIKDGQFVSIMGKSGSGKSTLLHMIGGLDIPTSGSVMYDDVCITDMTEQQRTDFRLHNIGFVFQSYHLIPELTVEENILLPSRLRGGDPDAAYYAQLIEMLSLGDRLTHLPTQLSGGQIQRAAIARALINKPAVVLCDEPTGNLDSAAGDNVKQLLLQVHKALGTTLIVVSHDKMFSTISDRNIVICDGKIEEDALCG